MRLWFKPDKEIRSKSGELHFRRWYLLKTPWFSVMIHRIYHHDCDLHMHTHPWFFFSIILWGKYTEKLKRHDEVGYIGRTIGTVGVRYKTDSHQIIDIQPPVTTLVFTGKRDESWGYDVDGCLLDHREYRKLKNEGKLP